MRARIEAARMASMVSLPRVHEPGNEDRESNGSPRSTPDAFLPELPQSARSSQHFFRNARFCTSQTRSPSPVPVGTGVFSVQDVHDAIVKEIPNALVSYVHDGTTPEVSTMISIGSWRDFSKAFRDSSPSFILVDSSEQSANLTIDMLRKQTGRPRGAIIIVLVAQDVTAESTAMVEKVPDYVGSGADDVVVIPVGATSIKLSILVSLAKANASRDQRMALEQEIRQFRNQCQGLFWSNAHDILDNFPKLQPNLFEACERRVGGMDLVSRLGSGTFGSVYRWVSRSRHASGAVKVFNKSRVSSASRAMQIAKECSVLKRLNHRNVVKFVRSAHGINCVYLFMEFAGTQTLFQVIRVGGPLPWSRAGGLFSQIADGVAHCHDMQIAHCDLKPENIVISNSGCAKIVDFGQAVELEAVVPLQDLLGTFPFTAPEIMRMCRDWDPPAADVWSLAVIMIEMLCGNNAFVRLVGWQSLGRGDMSKRSMAQRADELKAFFAKDDTNAHGHAFMAISRRCSDLPPPVIEMLGDVLVIAPEDRLCAESIAECVGQNLT